MLQKLFKKDPIDKYEAFACSCETPEHTMIVKYLTDIDLEEMEFIGSESTMYIQTQMNYNCLTWMDRFKIGVKYILGVNQSSMWSTTLLRVEDLNRLLNIVETTKRLEDKRHFLEHMNNKLGDFVEIVPKKLWQLHTDHTLNTCDRLTVGYEGEDSTKPFFCKVQIMMTEGPDKGKDMVVYSTTMSGLYYAQLQCKTMYLNKLYEQMLIRDERMKNIKLEDILDEDGIKELYEE